MGIYSLYKILNWLSFLLIKMKCTKVFEVLFYILCYAGLIYYCHQLIQKYLLNESTTKITTRRLNLETCRQPDCYPSATICFKSWGTKNKKKLPPNFLFQGNKNKEKCMKIITGTLKANDNDIKGCKFNDLGNPITYYMNNISYEHADRGMLLIESDNVENSYLDPLNQCFLSRWVQRNSQQ